MRLLITGVCGFVGSCTVRYLGGDSSCRNYLNLTCAQAEADCARIARTQTFDLSKGCSNVHSIECAGCPDQDGTLRYWDCSLAPPC